MEWLNYHHLYYFWTVARSGTVSAASRSLKLAQPTVSTQLRALSESLGVQLFQREGRTLRLTEEGKIVFRYAEEIFNLGRELQGAIKGQHGKFGLTLRVGIVDILPKLISYELLRPAFSLSEKISVHCREDDFQHLLGELASHELDVVLADAPLPPNAHIKAFSHSLGSSQISFFGTKKLISRLRSTFPKSLDNAPMLLPTTGTALRRLLDQWFDTHAIRPWVVAEFEDSALMKIFGQSGVGIFPSPTIISREIKQKYNVQAIGAAKEIKEHYYAISTERRLRHPAVIAISSTARQEFFCKHS